MAQEPWEVCPPQERLVQYSQGQLLGKPNEWTYRHLKFCSKCLKAIARIQRVPDPNEIIGGGSFLQRITQWFKQLFSSKKS